MRVVINFERKHAEFLLFGLGFIFLFGFVMAYNSGFSGTSGNPESMGHSADEMHVLVDSDNDGVKDDLKTLQDAIDNNWVGSVGWVANGSHIYNINTGNVGIGTGNPVRPLQVVGTIRALAYEDNENTNYYLNMDTGGRLKGLTVDDVIVGSVSGSAGSAGSVPWTGVSGRPPIEIRTAGSSVMVPDAYYFSGGEIGLDSGLVHGGDGDIRLRTNGDDKLQVHPNPAGIVQILGLSPSLIVGQTQVLSAGVKFGVLTNPPGSCEPNARGFIYFDDDVAGEQMFCGCQYVCRGLFCATKEWKWTHLDNKDIDC